MKALLCIVHPKLAVIFGISVTKFVKRNFVRRARGLVVIKLHCCTEDRWFEMELQS